jgi:hypothetical protein
MMSEDVIQERNSRDGGRMEEGEMIDIFGWDFVAGEKVRHRFGVPEGHCITD